MSNLQLHKSNQGDEQRSIDKESARITPSQPKGK